MNRGCSCVVRVAMDEGRFDRPVRVEIGGPGKIRAVTSTREAAECLVYRWPSDGGKKHLAARRACMQVLEGVKQAIVARRAFEAAAREADILLDPPKPPLKRK